MVNVDLRQLLGKLNFYCTNTLNNAAGLCVSRTNYEVTVEHWLIKCLESRDGDLAVLLDNNQEIISLLMKELNQSLDSNAGGNGGKPSFSPRLTDLLSDAWLIASVDLGLAQIRSGAVILAILEHPMVYGQEGWFKALKTLYSEKLKANFATYTAKSVESITPTAQDGVAADGSEKKGASANGGFIERFCQDFTKKADRKSTRLNSSHQIISYAVFCLKKKKRERRPPPPSHPPQARTPPTPENHQL